MWEISATEASRNFADLLDAVEHGDETFTITRRGRVVAQPGAPPRSNGAAVRRLLAEGPPDHDWSSDLRSLREFIGYEEGS
jgi:antitoxin (DNA-binding transcriptional repressor) of toxin-antitoxin stability system|tara:strand:+ start:94 stop:336 length:243 start_codon:yes stop_codon:yes gene_type:complete